MKHIPIFPSTIVIYSVYHLSKNHRISFGSSRSRFCSIEKPFNICYNLSGKVKLSFIPVIVFSLFFFMNFAFILFNFIMRRKLFSFVLFNLKIKKLESLKNLYLEMQYTLLEYCVHINLDILISSRHFRCRTKRMKCFR